MGCIEMAIYIYTVNHKTNKPNCCLVPVKVVDMSLSLVLVVFLFEDSTSPASSLVA